MRLIDVLQQTQAHCSILSESRPNNGRTVSDVAAMARYGFIRQDFASWFEDKFGKNIQNHVDAVAGLLIAFGLGVHSQFLNKTLLMSPGLYPLLLDWADPVIYPATSIQRIKLTHSKPEGVDLRLPRNLKQAFRKKQTLWSFFAAYVESNADLEIVDIAIERFAKAACTSLIISHVPMADQKQVFEEMTGKSMSFSGYLESLDLHIYYHSEPRACIQI
jgi:hypothetical protein